MLRIIFATVVCGVGLSSLSVSYAQNAPQTPAADTAGRATVQLRDSRPETQLAPLPPELEKLLADWARASAGIKRLEGEHLRRVYDMTFEVEKLSEGKFYFEFPDKGRIDVTATEVTPAMQQARLKNPAKVQKKKNGQPFDLEADRNEKWVCDGVRVHSIDDEKRTAEIMMLPPDLQGTNIMDSPLPFLFGMPPEKAKRRFELSFTRPFDPASGYAHIMARPRLPQDAQSWRQAEVILDLKTWLPVAVKLTDPAETKVTVFSFREMKVNNPGGWLRLIPGVEKERLFEPDLRDYQVQVLGDKSAPIANVTPERRGSLLDQPQLNAPGGRSPNTSQSAAVGMSEVRSADATAVRPAAANTGRMPDLTGQPWQAALAELDQLGFKRGAERQKVLLYKGSAATRPADANRVQQQKPAPGTPLTPETNVELWIWAAAASGK